MQRLIAEEHLPASIVRTSTIFGPGDHLNFGRIADRLLAGTSIVIGSGRNRVPFASADDVVQGLLLVLEHEAAEGEIYNITDDSCPTQVSSCERSPISWARGCHAFTFPTGSCTALRFLQNASPRRREASMPW